MDCNSDKCATEVEYTLEISKGCVPVYYQPYQNPATDCAVNVKCRELYFLTFLFILFFVNYAKKHSVRKF